MKKTLFPLLGVLSLIFSNKSQAQSLDYPANFTWFPTATVEDQKVQGPCNVFTAVANMEAWLYMFNSQTIALSQQHNYSKCTPEYFQGGSGTDVATSLKSLKNIGVVTNAIIPYGDYPRTVTCLSCPPNSYFADKLPTVTNCNDPFGATELYRVADYQVIRLDTIYQSTGLSTRDRLKRAIMNLGPISLNMVTSANSVTPLHDNSTPHAYLIYGWTPSGFLLKDSWPGTTTVYSVYGWTSTRNLITDINQGYTVIKNSAYVLAPTSSQRAVYKMKLVGAILVPDTAYNLINNGIPTSSTLDTVPIVKLSPGYYISGSAPDTATLQRLNFLEAGYTVKWGYDPGVVALTFASPNSLTSTFTTTGEGMVTITASITRKNGLKEVVKKSIYSVGSGIPIQSKLVSDYCSGTTRIVKWQIIGRNGATLPSSLTVAWNPQMPTGMSYSFSYSTTTFPNDNIILNLYNFTTRNGYALRPVVTDTKYNNITDGLTIGASESPCSGSFSAMNNSDSLSSTVEILIANSLSGKIRVYPNPATSNLNVELPDGKSYNIRLNNMMGAEMLRMTSTRTVLLDVSHFAAGTYVLTIYNDQDTKPWIGKIVIK